MPSDILRAENGTTDAIAWLQWLQLLNFELSGCQLATYPPKLLNLELSHLKKNRIGKDMEKFWTILPNFLDPSFHLTLKYGGMGGG